MASPSSLLLDKHSALRELRTGRAGRDSGDGYGDEVPRHEQPPSAVRTAQRLSLIGSSVVAAIALAALLGWVFDSDVAKRWLPEQVAMNPLTACCFIGLALALWLLLPAEKAQSTTVAARCIAGAVLAIAALKLGSIAIAREFELDRWLFTAQLAEGPGAANRMATRTALGFFAASTALLLLDAKTRARRRLSELLAVGSGLIGLLSLVAYAYGVLSYYRVPNFVPMALPTGCAFLVLATAILLARAERGVTAVVFSDTAGGFVARRLVPIAVLLPIVLGALRLVGQRAGWYDAAMGIAHLATAFIVLFLSAISWTAWILFRVDTERSIAEAGRRENEARLASVNAELERRVADRTNDLQQANRRLEESGRLARSTLDALSAHIAIVDEHGTIVSVNDAWRAFGQENGGSLQRTLAGMNYLQVCANATGDDAVVAEKFAAGVRAVLDGSEKSFALEYPCHGPERQRWFIGRVTRFEGPGPKMAVIAHEDVTARRLAEESLRFQAHLLKNSGEAAIATDLHGTVIYMNDFAEAMYGWPMGEALGRNIMEVTVPELSRKQAEEILERLRAGEGWHGEFLVHRRDGTTFPVSVTNTPLRDEHGAVTGVVGMSTDINKRKAAEEALRDSEQRFRQLAEHIHDVFWMVDLAYSSNIYVSPAYEMVWGRSVESLKRQPRSFTDAVVPEDRPALDRLLARQPDAPMEAEYRICRPDGSIRWIYDRAFPIRDENGKVYRIAGIAEDVTAQKETQLALRQSEAELRALATRLNAAREEEASRIARELHDELGQAMTGMMMDVAAAQRQLAAGDASAVEQVQRSLTRMRASLDETIAATRRICTELRPALLDQFGLLPAIEWQVQDFEARSEIFCNLVMCDCDPPITGEAATAIFRILQELLTNVARHANATEVCVELACTEANIQLIVRDNGCGLTQTAEQQSFGFGLIGIRERALAVGGHVVVSGEANRGTRVVVTAPRQEAANRELGT